MTSMGEIASRSGIGKRIWLKGFWGFDPESEGFLGYTRSGDRDRLLRSYVPGDLVLIYGTSSNETDWHDRGKALGFLEITEQRILASERMSAAAHDWRVLNGLTEKWNFAVPVVRAWRVVPGQAGSVLKRIAHRTYTRAFAQHIATRGELLEASEVKRALALDVVEVNVFQSERQEATRDVSLIDGFVPSRAFPPSSGQRSFTIIDGPCHLYLMRWSGSSEGLLGDVFGEIAELTVVKVGISNDPKARCAGLNRSLPPPSLTKWFLQAESPEFDSAPNAVIAETALKQRFRTNFRSIGGEFFLGDIEAIGRDFLAFTNRADG
ncbi:MAG TPA: hypothetical protein VII56_13155 [Rhizomicrobium sp.]